MPPLTPAALRKQLSTGDLAPLYLLTGSDDAEKSAMAGEFADSVEEGLRPFNVDRLYGGETSADVVIDAANTMPMIASRRIVVVMQAEKLLVPKGKAADEEKPPASR